MSRITHDANHSRRNMRQLSARPTATAARPSSRASAETNTRHYVWSSTGAMARNGSLALGCCCCMLQLTRLKCQGHALPFSGPHK